MAPVLVRLGPKGQIVIPKHLRRAKNMMPGDRMLVAEEDGKIVLQKPQDWIKVFEESARQIGHKGKIDLDKIYDEMYSEKWEKLLKAKKK